MEERCSTFSLHRLNQKFVQKVIVAAFLLVSCLPAMAQTGIRVTGVVTSGGDGDPLIGVNVIQKGTANGTVTDFDGNFELTVPVNSELEFSYIGFLNQTVRVTAGSTVYNVVLREDTQTLDEVVVIGYGVQKKKLVTGATVQVSSEDLQKMNSTTALGALQSQTPGVNITQSSGQPGENFKVTVRGLGTVGKSDPLYVIDGIAGGDINALNPSDIESVDVLKDAASASIYGARAANGVILVTTKKGKIGKMQLTYDGYYGVQNVYRMLPMLNAKEYMALTNEGRFNAGNSLYDWSYEIPVQYQQIQNGTWNGTNWLEAIREKNAPVQNHSFNLSGGNEMSRTSIGFSYTDQTGTFGKPVSPFMTRYTARVNSEHVLLKVKDFDAIKIGENLNYMYRENMGIGIGNIYWNDVHNAIVGNPLLPMYNSEGEYYVRADKDADNWNLAPGDGNPVALMVYERGQNINKNHILQMNAYIEVQPIKYLIWRSNFGYKMSANSYRRYTNAFNVSANNSKANDQVDQNMGMGYNWTWENTISYAWTVGDGHSFDAVIGQSVEKWGLGEEMSATGANSIFPNSFNNAYLDNANTVTPGLTSIGGKPWTRGALASFFGRVNYNYKETYLASVIMRADGSANFARGNRWGYFPSVSAGWVITNEAFMDDIREGGLDFFKLRASWGQNGNADIDNFQYLATIAFNSSNHYFFGYDKITPTTGAYADILANPDISWETSEQIDIGFDARILNSRLGIAFDWYKKTTKDWLVQAPVPATFGTGASYINGGDVENKGIEVGLNWNDYVGRDFSYGVNFNVTWNKNKVTRIANDEGIIHGDSHVLQQGMSEIYRAQEGFPLGYFYGYKTDGVFQNQEQIDNTPAKLENARPGDLIFVDTNEDGIIDESDRVMIGNPHPDVLAGLTLNFGYKGFDLSLTARGAFGQQIARSADFYNYTTEGFKRWHGEGTSNKVPRLGGGGYPNWDYFSELYVENGDYVKLQNLTLGYDFKKLFPQMPLAQARLYLAAQNLFTITGYSGMDPEVGYGNDKSWASGIDLGFYPAPRTYMVGVNLKF